MLCSLDYLSDRFLTSGRVGCKFWMKFGGSRISSVSQFAIHVAQDELQMALFRRPFHLKQKGVEIEKKNGV